MIYMICIIDMIYSPFLPCKKKKRWKKSNINGNGTKNKLQAFNVVCFADQCNKVGGSPVEWVPEVLPYVCFAAWVLLPAAVRVNLHWWRLWKKIFHTIGGTRHLRFPVDISAKGSGCTYSKGVRAGAQFMILFYQWAHFSTCLLFPTVMTGSSHLQHPLRWFQTLSQSLSAANRVTSVGKPALHPDCNWEGPFFLLYFDNVTPLFKTVS